MRKIYCNFCCCIRNNAWFQEAASLSDKEAELQKLQGLFQKLRDTDKADTEALAAAQRKFQAISSGLLTDDGGGDSTLQDQLMGTYVLSRTLSNSIWTLCLCMHVYEKKGFYWEILLHVFSWNTKNRMGRCCLERCMTDPWNTRLEETSWG